MGRKSGSGAGVESAHHDIVVRNDTLGKGHIRGGHVFGMFRRYLHNTESTEQTPTVARRRLKAQQALKVLKQRLGDE